MPRSTTAYSSPSHTGDDELAAMSVLKGTAGSHSVTRLPSLPGRVAELGQDDGTDFFSLI